MAAGGISSLNGLLKGLYPDETQVLRETAGEAARGSVRFGTVIRRWYGKLRGRLSGDAS
jgi:hypothetical protein